MVVKAVIKNVGDPNDKPEELPEFDTSYDDNTDYQNILIKGTEKQLVRRGATLILKYQRSRTEALKELARVVVSIRAKCTYNGVPDWGGNSRTAKDLVGEMYQQAGVDRDSESSMRKALSYHTNNLVRKVATKNELKVAGLLETTQSQRQVKKAAAGKKAIAATKSTTLAEKKTAELQQKEDDKKEEEGVPRVAGDNILAHVRIAHFHITEAAKMTPGAPVAKLDDLKAQANDVMLTARNIVSQVAHRQRELKEKEAASKKAAATKAAPKPVENVQKSA